MIADQLRALGVRSVRRTEDGTVVAADCLLVDTTGELRDWYSVATIVFMGKSLAARGGQNPVEAIVADRPVSFRTAHGELRCAWHEHSSQPAARCSRTMKQP